MGYVSEVLGLFGIEEKFQVLGKSCRDSGKNIASLLVQYLPLQSGGLSVRTTCPYRHVAVIPPRLVYPPGQLSIRVVP